MSQLYPIDINYSVLVYLHRALAFMLHGVHVLASGVSSHVFLPKTTSGMTGTPIESKQVLEFLNRGVMHLATSLTGGASFNAVMFI